MPFSKINEVHPRLKITRLPPCYEYHYYMYRYSEEGWWDMPYAAVCDGLLFVTNRRGKHGALNAYGQELIPCIYDYINYKEQYLLGDSSAYGRQYFKVGVYDEEKAYDLGKNTTKAYQNHREEDFITKIWDEERQEYHYDLDTPYSYGIIDYNGKKILPCVYDHIEAGRVQTGEDRTIYHIEGRRARASGDRTFYYWIACREYRWQAFYKNGQKLLEESFYNEIDLMEAVNDFIYKNEVPFGREYDRIRLAVYGLTPYKGSGRYYYLVEKAGQWGALELNGTVLVSSELTSKDAAKQAVKVAFKAKDQPVDKTDNVRTSPYEKDLKTDLFTELQGTISGPWWAQYREYRNAEGEIVISSDMKFNRLHPIGRRLFRAQSLDSRKDSQGLVDEFGNIILPLEFAEDIFTTNTGKIVVTNANRREWYFFDEATGTLGPSREGHIRNKWRNLGDYYLVTDHYDCSLRDFPSGLFSIVDGDGNVILPFEYSHFFTCYGAPGFTCSGKGGLWYHMEFAAVDCNAGKSLKTGLVFNV